MSVPARVSGCDLLIYSDPIGYDQGLVLQESYVNEVAAGGPEKLMLLEHSHVITLGRGFHQENLLFTKEWFREHDIDVSETGRGGDVTYHGP